MVSDGFATVVDAHEDVEVVLAQWEAFGGVELSQFRAPFDGYAWSSSSPYGGYQVRVRGDRGYVFVAHLIAYGDLGWVDAGTTVGYVGDTGLSTAPHAHVEWHPWDGGAVDPYSYLRLSCG